MYLVKMFKNVRMTFNFLFNLTVLIRFMVKKGRDGKYTHSLDMHFIESIANYIYFSEYRNYHDEYQKQLYGTQFNFYLFNSFVNFIMIARYPIMMRHF